MLRLRHDRLTFPLIGMQFSSPYRRLFELFFKERRSRAFFFMPAYISSTWFRPVHTFLFHLNRRSRNHPGLQIKAFLQVPPS